MKLFQVIIIMIAAALGTSCGGVKKAKKDMLILQQGSLDTLPNLTVPIREAVIQPNDILSIVVYSDNPEANSIFNDQSTSPPSLATDMKISDGAVSGKSGAARSYVVDKNGEIKLQLVGAVKVAGLTRAAMADSLNHRLAVYLQNPFVDVRFVNLRVTVLGEVQRPGVVPLPNEQVSILELVGMAGDLTVYGRRDNVLVIREQNGKRQFGRVDLRRADIFQSPYYYLQQNDLVVVESTTKKPTATEQENYRKMSLVAGFASLVSTISILITLFK